MIQEIKDKLLWRATIIENLSSLIKSCSRGNSDQLSLFEDIKSEMIHLKIPEDVDYEEMINKEANVLGVSLTYNIQDKYVLHSKKFCNHTLRSIDELSISSDKLVFIAKIDNIEYRVSSSGNNYAKIFWKDYDSITRMYLFGKTYQKFISKAFKGQYYLCEAIYNKDNESLSMVKFKAINEIEIKDYVSVIELSIDDIRLIPELRSYVFKNMIGSDYDLIFNFKDTKFKAPYKINFNEDNYLDIRDLITNLSVKNNG